ncbi:MAG TPA: START domain-containing protein [Polyangia bacterium]|nr:START domain-containing protein [Polyangia bacterium]
MFRLLVLFLPLLTAPPDFKHVGGAHGVEVFRQMSSPVIDLYAEGDIDAPPAIVRDVLLDYDHASKVTKNVGESRVLAKNNREIIVYQRLKLPVISDRDFTLRATWGQRGPTLIQQFTVDNAKGPPARDGIVRVSTMQGTWALDPIRDGASTHARYHVQIDLGGSVPKWMVSGGAAKNLPKLFEGVRREASARIPGAQVAGRGQWVP